MARVRTLAIPVLALSVLVWSVGLRAQGATKTARGTVTSVAADAVTVSVGGKDMKFTVDTKTQVTARGAGTAAREAQKKGEPGAKLVDVVKKGQAVEVRYHESGGSLHAASITAVASAGPGGGSVSEPKPATKTASGTVKSVAAASLTVTADGKDLTFAIDSKTNVVGTGVGTKTKQMGGKAAITDLVAVGDRVTVTYHEAGMHAANVRITQKGKLG